MMAAWKCCLLYIQIYIKYMCSQEGALCDDDDDSS